MQGFSEPRDGKVVCVCVFSDSRVCAHGRFEFKGNPSVVGKVCSENCANVAGREQGSIDTHRNGSGVGDILKIHKAFAIVMNDVTLPLFDSQK